MIGLMGRREWHTSTIPTKSLNVPFNVLRSRLLRRSASPLLDAKSFIRATTSSRPETCATLASVAAGMGLDAVAPLLSDSRALGLQNTLYYM